MKIKLNYENVYDCIQLLKKYSDKLSDLKHTVTMSRDSIAENNSGEAIEIILLRLDNKINEIKSAEATIEKATDIMKDFFMESQALVSPKNDLLDVIVDPDLVSQNIGKMENDIHNDITTSESYLQNAIYDLSTALSSEDSEAISHNMSLLTEMKNMLENNKYLLDEEIDNIKYEHKKLALFDEIDQEYARQLSDLATESEHFTAYTCPVTELDSNGIDFDSSNLNLTYEQKLQLQLEIQMNKFLLSGLGWNDEEIEVYNNEVISEIENSSSYEEAKEKVRQTNIDSRTIGSDTFNNMLEHNTEGNEDRKLKIVKTYYDLGMPQSKNLSKYDGGYNDYFGIINNLVNKSSYLNEGLSEEPTEMQYFIHTELRMELNNSVINGYNGGETGLREMFEDGWVIKGYNGEGSSSEILKQSRYHQIGYPIKLSDNQTYNPKFNIKVISEDGKFERIYNTQLGMFLDEIVVIYENDFNEAGVSTVTNIETYNYGKSGGKEDFHLKYDVNTYLQWGTDYYDEYELFDSRLKGMSRDDYEEYVSNDEFYTDDRIRGSKTHSEDDPDIYDGMIESVDEVVDIYEEVNHD